MIVSRRNLLKLPALTALASATQAMPALAQSGASGTVARGDWNAVRALFDLTPDRIHMGAMLLASHPAPVREAIEKHRRALDANPVQYLEANDEKLSTAAREAAGAYLGIDRSQVALTDSTTMGVGLVYSGLRLRPGDEILTTEHDYFVTDESLRLAAARADASVRKISLFEESATAGAEQIVSKITEAVTPATRLVALTWVHSSTGVKIPVAEIAAAIAEINQGRDEAEQILFGLDGVHGFGVEHVDFESLGCDFLMAGCHKWLFGPRGTGIIAASRRGLDRLAPLIPSFDDPEVMTRWINGDEKPAGAMNGLRLTPGGFKPFEHRWAISEAFALHERIGRREVEQRTHELASLLKSDLGRIAGISIMTPPDPKLSAGIVSFDVEGRSAEEVVSRLRSVGVIGSVAPYARPHVRLTPSIMNSEEDVERAAAALGEIA